MTAVALFDLLARERAVDSSTSPEQLAQLAEKLVAVALEDLDRVHDYESGIADRSSPDRSADLNLRRTIWRLYFEWANDAEDVLARARSLEGGGTRIEKAARLNDAIGRIRARLSVTPEQSIRAIEQVRQGQFVPAKELRDELHARLRA